MQQPELPELGVGIVFFPGLEPLLEAGRSLIDVIEIEPQPFWYKHHQSDSPYTIDRTYIDRIVAFPQRKIVHGVGFPVGSSQPIDQDQLTPFLETVSLLEAPWVSEHLSFLKAGSAQSSFNTGFLLPPLQTNETVRIAAEKIGELKSRLGVSFAFETGVNYLRPIKGEMADGEFWRAVAEEADCGIVLDLHNLWANQLNGRQSVMSAVSQLPLDRVWEIHLAGGDKFRNYWLDAHSDLTPVALIEVAEEVISWLPNLRAIVFEIIPDYLAFKNIDIDQMLDHIKKLRQLWSVRGTKADRACFYERQSRQRSADRIPSTVEWENSLGSLVVGRPAGNTLAEQLSQDPGVDVLRELVANVRAGMTVECLKLSYRLLVLSVGEAAFQTLLKRFWESTPPEVFALEEARNFADYLRAQSIDVPHLAEVLAYELASQQVLIERESKVVRFSCDPMPLLTALGEGHLPEDESVGEYEIVIDPLSESTVDRGLEQL
jgi:uncharacterized protein (UPF0276 family)